MSDLGGDFLDEFLALERAKLDQEEASQEKRISRGHHLAVKAGKVGGEVVLGGPSAIVGKLFHGAAVGVKAGAKAVGKTEPGKAVGGAMARVKEGLESGAGALYDQLKAALSHRSAEAGAVDLQTLLPKSPWARRGVLIGGGTAQVLAGAGGTAAVVLTAGAAAVPVGVSLALLSATVEVADGVAAYDPRVTMMRSVSKQEEERKKSEAVLQQLVEQGKLEEFKRMGEMVQEVITRRVLPVVAGAKHVIEVGHEVGLDLGTDAATDAIVERFEHAARTAVSEARNLAADLARAHGMDPELASNITERAVEHSSAEALKTALPVLGSTYAIVAGLRKIGRGVMGPEKYPDLQRQQELNFQAMTRRGLQKNKEKVEEYLKRLAELKRKDMVKDANYRDAVNCTCKAKVWLDGFKKKSDKAFAQTISHLEGVSSRRDKIKNLTRALRNFFGLPTADKRHTLELTRSMQQLGDHLIDETQKTEDAMRKMLAPALARDSAEHKDGTPERLNVFQECDAMGPWEALKKAGTQAESEVTVSRKGSEKEQAADILGNKHEWLARVQQKQDCVMDVARRVQNLIQQEKPQPTGFTPVVPLAPYSTGSLEIPVLESRDKKPNGQVLYKKLGKNLSTYQEEFDKNSSTLRARLRAFKPADVTAAVLEKMKVEFKREESPAEGVIEIIDLD